MKYFTIFGERNSGTNYLQKIMIHNYRLKFTKKFGFKHWFIRGFQPRGAPNTTTDNECLTSLDNSQDTLFLFIVRNPLDWTEAMYRSPYHIPTNPNMDISSFIRRKHVSKLDSLPVAHDEGSDTTWYPDKTGNHYFIEVSKNIITLRNEKNDHFYNLRNKVKYFQLVKMESLLTDVVTVQKTFDLTPIRKKVELFEYRKPQNSKLLSLNDRNFITNNLNNCVDNLYYL